MRGGYRKHERTELPFLLAAHPPDCHFLQFYYFKLPKVPRNLNCFYFSIYYIVLITISVYGDYKTMRGGYRLGTKGTEGTLVIEGTLGMVGTAVTEGTLGTEL